HTEAQLRLVSLMAGSPDREVLEAAEQRMQNVLAIAPDASDALDMMAVVDVRLGKLDDASELLEQAFDKSPADFKAAANLARFKLARRDLPGAEEAFKTLSAKLPQSSDAALALGQVYLLEGKKTEGEAEVRRAIQLSPKNTAAMLMLAYLQISG